MESYLSHDAIVKCYFSYLWRSYQTRYCNEVSSKQVLGKCFTSVISDLHSPQRVTHAMTIFRLFCCCWLAILSPVMVAHQPLPYKQRPAPVLAGLWLRTLQHPGHWNRLLLVAVRIQRSLWIVSYSSSMKVIWRTTAVFHYTYTSIHFWSWTIVVWLWWRLHLAGTTKGVSSNLWDFPLDPAG